MRKVKSDIWIWQMGIIICLTACLMALSSIGWERRAFAGNGSREAACVNR